ncbi:hypothetical protein HUU42_06645 [bacterium]|nr:hypothetical protein [bacterium]
MVKMIIAVVAVFIAWSALDFVIHGVILQSAYASMPQLWRPMEEMKMGLMYFVTFLNAVIFTMIYSKFITQKTLANALSFGIMYGLAAGLSMGYGTYSVQPIPYTMALTWFLGTLIEMAVAGVIVGLIIKE